jgi:thiosulfate dehydrogenase [quinone] large subunit
LTREREWHKVWRKTPSQNLNCQTGSDAMNPVSPQERIESSSPERGARIARYAGRTGDNSQGRALGYFILRLSLGVDMLMHYVVRTWGISQDFVLVTEKMFVGNLLPMSWVHVFLTILPYFEGLLGVLLVLGLLSRWALTAEGLLVTVLLFGTALRSDWTVVSHQMIYLLFVFILLAVEDYDYFSVDAFLTRRRRLQ